MNSKSENVRPNYSIDRLGISEIGPGSLAQLILFHLNAIPDSPIMTIGEPGIGKTAIVNQLELTGDYVILTKRLVNEDEGTMNGYADPDDDSPTVTLRVTRDIVETAEAAKKAGKKLIVFFDEVNRAKEHMIKYVFNIIDQKRWGSYQLPSNTSFIAAINPPTKNHKVRDVLADSALRRRFVLYGCKADNAEYLEYAKKAKIHQSVISFIHSKPKYIYDYEALDNNKPYACPATWDKVSDVVKTFVAEGGRLQDISKNTPVNRILSGTIGEAMTYEFLTFAEDMTKRYAPENILNNYKDLQPEIQETVNSEFTEEDAALDLSKLATVVNTLAMFLADQVVNKDMEFHIDDKEREEKDISKKAALKINKKGHNLAKFLLDCPSELFQSFYATIRKEIEALTKGTDKKYHFYLSKTSKLSNYSEYKDAAQRYMQARK